MSRTTLPDTLDWGKVTAEFYDDVGRRAVHVMNHDLESAENFARTLRFASARVRWASRQFPEGVSQVVLFDDRAQKVSSSKRDQLRSELEKVGAQAGFMSEGLPRGLQPNR